MRQLTERSVVAVDGTPEDVTLWNAAVSGEIAHIDISLPLPSGSVSGDFYVLFAGQRLTRSDGAIEREYTLLS